MLARLVDDAMFQRKLVWERAERAKSKSGARGDIPPDKRYEEPGEAYAAEMKRREREGLLH
jgi:hypothetical protein